MRPQPPRPDRWPACASSTSRRSSPVRTARCSWPTSGRTSSRSSRPRATRPAAGARHGSATRRPAPGPRPTTWRSTATSAPSGSTSAATGGADVLRRLLADADVLVENFRPGVHSPGSASTTMALRALNPDLIHLAISGYGPDGPAADRPGYDFVIQAVGGLMSITGDADSGRRPPDQGRRRDQRCRDRAVRRDRRSWPACWPGSTAWRPAGPRPADRRVAPRLHAGRARQPGPERVRRPARRPAGVATPTPTSCRTRRSRRADGELAVAVGSERQWPRFCEALGLPELVDRSAVRDQRRSRRESRRACGRCSPRGFASRSRPTGWRPSSRPRSRRSDPRHRGRVRAPRGAGPSDDGRAGAIRSSARSARPGSRSSSGDAGRHPNAAAAPRRAHRRGPGRHRLRRSAIEQLRRDGAI